ncbi:hypothetical protein [Burkholderia cenocepacia]|uniref:hypothetical protein n=1 Tax=Burkholderia cenocepacia TaxID=95486 RepID=UPI002AB28B40|nr:hypothetical protein [Burkholderia cenocepacia]
MAAQVHARPSQGESRVMQASGMVCTLNIAVLIDRQARRLENALARLPEPR